MQIQVFGMTTQVPDQTVQDATVYTPQIITEEDILYVKREKKEHMYEIRTAGNELFAFPTGAYMIPHLSLTQVDRGIYVNMAMVKQLNVGSHELELVNGDTVSVSQNKMNEVKNLLPTNQ